MKNQHIIRRAEFALEGLKAAWRSERSVRTHGMAIGAAALVFIFLGATPIWWVLFSLAAGLMLVTELINTAVEKLVDRLHPDIHPDVKFVKDVLAGAVLASCAAAGCVMLAFLYAALL